MSNTGFKHSEKTKEKLRKMSAGKNNSRYGKHCSEGTKEKIRVANFGKKRTPEQLANMSAAHQGMKPPGFGGRKHSDESKAKMKLAMDRRYTDPINREKLISAVTSSEYRANHSKVMKSVWNQPTHRAKMAELYATPEYHKYRSEITKRVWNNPEVRAKITGANNYNWHGGSSFKTYCPKFNTKLKEEIRDAFGRKCFLCGANEGHSKHHVHHCDYNKGQGCGQRWSLVPLCKSCHSKTNYHRHYYFNLLANYWAMNPDIKF